MALPLPARVVGTYFTLWTGTSRITAVPTDYNQIYLFHSTPTGGGAFGFGYGNAVTAAEIKQCQSRGQRVVMTCGGANAGYNFANRSESTAFVASFKAINDSLGGTLDGCDFNNFEAQIGSNPVEMTWIAQQLKAAYGKDFSITCPPGPDAGYAPGDRTLTKAMAAAGVLDYAGPQFYDSPDLCQQSVIVKLIDEWVANLGGDASKVVIGLSSNYAAGPDIATSQAAWKQCLAKYPNLRGVFAWSAADDARAGYSWGKAMGSLVKGGAPAPKPAPSIGGAWIDGTMYYPGDVVTKNGKSYKLTNAGSNGTSDGTDPEVSSWYWTAIVTPAPKPVPAPSAASAWLANTTYHVGDVVTKNGKTFKLTNVGSAGTSDGTDPEVSSWYWTVITEPTPTLKVGDRVTVGSSGNTGSIIAISGAAATVKLDTVVSVQVSTLKKV